MLLVCVWARFKPAHMSSWHSRVSSRYQASTDYHATRVRPPSALFWFLQQHLETSWVNCVTLELKQHRYLRTGVSAVFLIGLSMTFTQALHHMLFVLSPFPVRSLLQYLVVP